MRCFGVAQHQKGVANAMIEAGYPVTGLMAYWQSLTAIHAAPQWLWSALVTKVLTEALTVEKTRDAVKRVQHLDAPPACAPASSDERRCAKCRHGRSARLAARLPVPQSLVCRAPAGRRRVHLASVAAGRQFP